MNHNPTVIDHAAGVTVRLTPRELQGLLSAFNEVLPPLGDVRVYLFGSRTQPQAKGGDIDLLIECTEHPGQPFTKLTRMLWLAIENNLGEERRVDIVWDAPGHHNAFAQIARNQGVLLWPTPNN